MNTALKLSITYGSGGFDQQFRQTVLFRTGVTENRVINLYPEITYQTFDGFGGAITEAAGSTYNQMNEAQKQALMYAYFGKERMNYQYIRLPIDSCDFSLSQYEASSKPDFSDFSLERVKQNLWPMLDDAEKAAGRKLKLILTPWSPPAYMKTNGKRDHGGKLKPEYEALWAEYLCRYIQEYRNHGYQVVGMTLQNEPKAVQTWDSCVFTAQEEKHFLKDVMRPALEKHGLSNIQIYLWDHNKERVWEWMRDIIDEETSDLIAGAAFHWYSGDHFDSLDLCRTQFPDKKLIVSESCIEYSKFDPNDACSAALHISHELMGDLNHGISAFIDWNLLVDEQGGPNYVDNYCLAPFLYDTRKKKLMPHLISQFFEHFAHAVQPGSVRIAATRYAEEIEVTAWKQPDGTLAGVLINRSAEPKPICVRLRDQEAGLLLQPHSIADFTVQ
ncbi:MAG: glucosylceramidase [Clostridia bacterium]|nr:glucosylceramidase [Clostridia bacterium]